MMLSSDSAAAATGEPTPPATTNWRRLGGLVRKELRETLRDRRTVGTLVLMPLLVYPLLAIAFQRFLVSHMPTSGEVHYAVGVNSEDAAKNLDSLLRVAYQRRHPEAARQSGPEDGSQPAPEKVNSSAPRSDASSRDTDDLRPSDLRWFVGDQLDKQVADVQVDAAVRVTDRAGVAEQPAKTLADIEIIFRERSETSRRVALFLERSLRDVNEVHYQFRLQSNGVSDAVPLNLSYRGVANNVGGVVSLSSVIPLVLILMTITGAVYPAIDLTAGERERGTLEALMAAPVPRMGLLFAKYVAVLTVALLTAMANLLAMFGTAFGTGLNRLLFGELGLTASAVAQVLLLLVLFAGFFAAVLLAVTSFARSFKEAQAYLIPLMLVALAPGLLSLTPGLRLGPLLAVTPLVNIVLLTRDILQGGADIVPATVSIVSTVLYALAALTLAAKIFGADAILYGSERGWSELWRPPREPSDRPSLAMIAVVTALLFPLFFLAGGLLALQQHWSVASRLVASGVLTAVLFAGLPLIVARRQRVDLRSGFQLRRAPASTWIAAVLLGLATWPIAHELFLVGRAIGLASLSEEQFTRVESLLSEWRKVSPLLVLAAAALAPAIAEELFFRGWCLGALRGRVRGMQAILVSAILFGLFHTFIGSHLASERLLPSTFLGIVLGWICWRSRSVLPGMLLHGLHNGLLLMVAYYRGQLEAWGIGVGEREHLPALWLVGSCAVTSIGLWLASARPRSGQVPACPEPAPSNVPA